MPERLRGHITLEEFSPLSASSTYKAEFMMLPSSHVEVIFETASRLVPGAAVVLELTQPRRNSTVIDETTGKTWACNEVRIEEDGLQTFRTPVLVISSEMQARLHERAREAGVEAEVLMDDMERPVLIVRTSRGTIRRGITGLDSWHQVLESVGLGGTL